MPEKPATRTIGDQELALLQFVGSGEAKTVAEAVEGFGQPRGLARSTVLTMMERLRRKGHLTRQLVDGVYRYSPKTPHGTAVRNAVHAFVRRTLGGSVSPFVAYLAEQERLSDEEIGELEALVARLQKERRSRP